ncbi:MAG: 50S ribosomal protein L11 methyltransferase [Lachnospiraceae bacterium]|nr:50S ribosomal protein L11 methyltransferase [Lachnospiraceae bacterium]
MKWKKFTIETTTEAVDLISEALHELGVEGIEIEDYVPLTEAETKGMFIDILPELPPDDGTAKVTFYLDEDARTESLLASIREEIARLEEFIPVGAGAITESETEDKDWINNWKEYFHPFTVEDILIKPTWEAVPEEHKEKCMIEIDPGTAFGTGSHETTQLCIRALKKHIRPGDRVLDVGTGSGILAIAALKLGAGMAFGTDLDECAVTAARENAEINGIGEEQFPIILGNLIDDEDVQRQAGLACYDVVTANILAPVILALQEGMARHMKRGAVFITSGIINTKADEVREALRRNPDWEFCEENAQGDWVSFVVRKR